MQSSLNWNQHEYHEIFHTVQQWCCKTLQDKIIKIVLFSCFTPRCFAISSIGKWELRDQDLRRLEEGPKKFWKEKKMLMIKWRCSFFSVFTELLSLFSRTESRALFTYSELELNMTPIPGLWRELNLHLISINSFGDIILHIQLVCFRIELKHLIFRIIFIRRFL